MKTFFEKQLALWLVVVMCIFSMQVGVLAEETVPENLLFNGDFEISTDGKIPDGWEYNGELTVRLSNSSFEDGREGWAEGGLNDGGLVIDINDGHSGNSSLMVGLTQTSSRQFIKRYIPASPGSTYSVSYWYKTSDDYAPSGNSSVFLSLNCLDSSNQNAGYKLLTESPLSVANHTYRFPVISYHAATSGNTLTAMGGIQQVPYAGGMTADKLNTEWTLVGDKFYTDNRNISYPNKYSFAYPTLHHFDIQIMVGTGVGTIWFDDIELAKLGGIDETIKNSGNYSLVAGGYNDVYEWVSTPVDVEPGKCYVVDGYVYNFHTRTFGTGKTENPTDREIIEPVDGSPLGTTVKAVFRDSDGDVIETKEVAHIAEEENWEQVNPDEIAMIAPEGAATMTVDFHVNGCSTAYFDDFSVYESAPQCTTIAADRTTKASFDKDFTAEPTGIRLLPYSDEAYTIKYRAVALDQSGAVMPEATVEWSVNDELPDGVTITPDGNTVAISIPANLVVDAVIPLMAQCGEVFNTYYLKVKDFKSVNISGYSKIEIPTGKNYTVEYSAEAVDSLDNNLGHTFKYELGSTVEGVTIDADTGLLTVKPTAAIGEVEVIAVSDVCELLKASKTVSITRAKKVEASNEAPKKTGPSGGGGGGAKINPIIIPTPIPTPIPETTAPSVTEPTQETGFKDLSDVEWAKESIMFLADKGAISGVGNGEFAPNNNVTRAEFAKILSLAFEASNSEASCDFTDVCSDDWFYPYVASLTELGITGGIGDGSFGAQLEISRQDIATMIYRLAIKSGYTFDAEIDVKDFADDKNIAEYAKEAVYKLRAAGILNGVDNGEFQPERECTRAEAAKLIYSAFIAFNSEATGGNINE